MPSDHTRPSDATRRSERHAADAAHDAGRAPSPDEEKAAESAGAGSDTEAHYREMQEKGTEQKGEGRIG